ncbi:hypothetical protein VTL71DRAFT_6795 [Oculimacula yallundae]|uniref:holo-[acyl-carrier-protein] synthase n=1 Tax=Oculimacula yallundae TaxID=86028 RepID=A0ABR4BXY8_9HELO
MDASNTPHPFIVQWFIDTRPLWPVPKQAKSKDEVQALKTVAAQELSLLSEAEQKSVLRYYHVRDAKTKLASHLLKHFVITKYGGVPWNESTISRGEKGKPFFTSPNLTSDSSSPTRLEFNVSHQAGLVSLIAAINFSSPVSVGTDIVNVSERQALDDAYIDKSGLFSWIDMHSDVFSASELSEMKLKPVPVPNLPKNATLSGYGKDAISRCQWRGKILSVKAVGEDGEDSLVQVDSGVVVEAKRRRFYAFWCLREAYVKMTGEAFAAPWLKELDILGVDAPMPAAGSGESHKGGKGNVLTEGEVKRDFNITFKERKVADVKMELSALGDESMIAGAVKVPSGQSVEMGIWVELDLKDILELAVID